MGSHRWHVERMNIPIIFFARIEIPHNYSRVIPGVIQSRKKIVELAL